MEFCEIIYEAPSPALTRWRNRRHSRALLDAASPCERLGSRAVARWIVNLFFLSHTRVRSMFVPETQLLESLSDDEGNRADAAAIESIALPYSRPAKKKKDRVIEDY